MFRILLFIAAGSSIGGVARYLIQHFTQRYFPSYIPLGTLTVNIIGSFFIGLIYALAEKDRLVSPEARIFLATGLCGGFTTFSAFTYENIKLLEDGAYFYTALYTITSVAVGFFAVYLGIIFVKLIS